MALRINNAKDFAGRFYLTTAALASIIQGFSFDNETNVLTLSAGSQTSTVNLSGLVKASANTQFIGVTNNTLDDTALVSFLRTTGGSATADKIVTTNENGKLDYTLAKATAIPAAASDATDSDIPTVKAVKTYVDEHGISLTSTDSSVTITNGDGVTKNLATNLYLKAIGSNTTNAQRYQLQIGNGDGATAIGATIDIPRDQFLSSVDFIASAAASDVTSAGANPGFEEGYPVLHFVFSNASGVEVPVYVPVKELVDVYTAGDGISIDANNSNAIAVKIENTTSGYTVFTGAGTSTTLIESTDSGVKVANIGAAISTAVRDEHAKMSAAVTAVETNVSNLQTSTSAAITALDANVDTLRNDTESAVNGLASDINALDSKTSGAIASVNTNLSNAVSSAMANVSAAVTTHTANAVQMIETTVSPSAGSSTGIYEFSINANNIVAVYGTSEGGAQIYPLITRTSAAGSAGAYNYKLEADYGTAQSTVEQWTVLYTLPLSAYNATAVNTGSATYTTDTVTAGTISATGDVTAPAAPTPVTVSGLTYDTVVSNG